MAQAPGLKSMSQKFAVNLLLLALVIGLGLLYWLPKAPQIEQLATLTGRSPESLRVMRMEFPDGSQAEFERSGPDVPWQMTRPWQVPANQGYLDALARLVEAPVFDSFPLVEARRGDFGLDRPLRLQLDDLSLAFGNTNPLNQHRYLLEGNRVVLMVDRFYHHLIGGPESLVSPALLPPGLEILAIQGPEFRLEQGAAGWQLVPASSESSADVIKDYLDAWHEAQGLGVRHFAESEVSGTGQSWQLELGQGQNLDFTVGDFQGSQWLVRQDNGLGYQLPKHSALLRSPASIPAPVQPEAAHE